MPRDMIFSFFDAKWIQYFPSLLVFTTGGLLSLHSNYVAVTGVCTAMVRRSQPNIFAPLKKWGEGTLQNTGKSVSKQSMSDRWTDFPGMSDSQTPTSHSSFSSRPSLCLLLSRACLLRAPKFLAGIGPRSRAAPLPTPASPGQRAPSAPRTRPITACAHCQDARLPANPGHGSLPEPQRPPGA